MTCFIAHLMRSGYETRAVRLSRSSAAQPDQPDLHSPHPASYELGQIVITVLSLLV